MEHVEGFVIWDGPEDFIIGGRGERAKHLSVDGVVERLFSGLVGIAVDFAIVGDGGILGGDVVSVVGSVGGGSAGIVDGIDFCVEAARDEEVGFIIVACDGDFGLHGFCGDVAGEFFAFVGGDALEARAGVDVRNDGIAFGFVRHERAIFENFILINADVVAAALERRVCGELGGVVDLDEERVFVGGEAVGAEFFEKAVIVDGVIRAGDGVAGIV